MREPTILVIAGDAVTLAAVSQVAEAHEQARVVTASGVDEAWPLSIEARPDLVLVPTAEARPALDMLRRISADADPPDPPSLLAIANPGESGLEALLAEPGVDGLLVRPVRSESLLPRVRHALRARRLEGRLRVEQQERERLERTVKLEREPLNALLIALIDASIPGARERGERIADLAGKLAARFGVPDALLPDLDIAARLHEVGHLAAGPVEVSGPQLVPRTWQFSQAAKAILNHAPALESAAELIGSIYENWDGTGLPERLLQGQIPLRCRFLRILIDYFEGLAEPESPTADQVLATLAEHSGTRYDPMVVVHLQALIEEQGEGELRNTKQLVPINALEAGMVLAEDLYTSSGLKLLSRETSISTSMLDTIVRRHRVDPILSGAAVHRRTG